MQATVVIIASAYEFSAKFVFNVNADNVVEGLLGSGEAELERPVGDEITLGAKAKEMALVLEAQQLAEREIPDYVAPDGAAKKDRGATG